MVLGMGLAQFLSVLKSLPQSLYVAGPVVKKVWLLGLVQTLGLGAFLCATLAGAGYVFSLSALLFGRVAGTVWYRFNDGRSFSNHNRLGVTLAAFAMVTLLLFDVSFSGVDLSAPNVWVVRSLSLMGAVIWGVAQYSYNPKQVLVSRQKWAFWESFTSVVTVLFLGGLVQVSLPDQDLIGFGFRSEPLLVVPVLLAGVVLGALKQRLVLAWEATVRSPVLTAYWVSAAALTAMAVVFFVRAPGFNPPELFPLLVLAIGFLMAKLQGGLVSDYRGPKVIPSGSV